MTAYYNEFDPKAAAWLRELVKRNLIAPGDVDERSILDVRPDEIRDYTQCHFFAGIGVWSYALRNAGWADDQPVWTGSCPCQPFSAAGKGSGFDDERHLWPHFHWLIEQCRPAIVLGEQVASKDGLGWLDLVQADLEGTGYASGAVDTCAAGFGAPHIRQRLYWIGKRLADASSEGLALGSIADDGRGTLWEERQTAAESGVRSGVADATSGRRGEFRGQIDQRRIRHADGSINPPGGLADADGRNAGPEGIQRGGQQRQQPEDGRTGDGGRPGPTNGFWRASDWLHCRDGKWRPVEPGTFPLAHGAAARVGRLRGYGNAINAAQAQGFIEAVLETDFRHLWLEDVFA